MAHGTIQRLFDKQGNRLLRDTRERIALRRADAPLLSGTLGENTAILPTAYHNAARVPAQSIDVPVLEGLAFRAVVLLAPEASVTVEI